MTRFLHLTSALSALIALSAPAAHAGKTLQRPALDGREVELPDGRWIVGAPVAEEVHRIATNGPALDGREVELPSAGARLGRIPEIPRTK